MDLSAQIVLVRLSGGSRDMSQHKTDPWPRVAGARVGSPALTAQRHIGSVPPPELDRHMVVGLEILVSRLPEIATGGFSRVRDWPQRRYYLPGVEKLHSGLFDRSQRDIRVMSHRAESQSKTTEPTPEYFRGGWPGEPRNSVEQSGQSADARPCSNSAVVDRGSSLTKS